MEFNTSTLGYKLRSGKLRERRKHSEQLNKYLAGLFDADGYTSITFENNKLRLRAGLTQSFSNDPDATTLRALRDFHNLGNINYTSNGSDKTASQAHWMLYGKAVRMLFNRIGKHLRIKATHLENLIYLWEELSEETLSDNAIEEIKEYSKCSRENSKWLKHPKHPSWAWTAGYLDGDGSYQPNKLRVTATAKGNDSYILYFLKTAFKGSVYEKKTEDAFVWERYIGKSDKSFALPFLKKMRMYTCLPFKYEKINELIKPLTETKQ